MHDDSVIFSLCFDQILNFVHHHHLQQLLVFRDGLPCCPSVIRSSFIIIAFVILHSSWMSLTVSLNHIISVLKCFLWSSSMAARTPLAWNHSSLQPRGKEYVCCQVTMTTPSSLDATLPPEASHTHTDIFFLFPILSLAGLVWCYHGRSSLIPFNYTNKFYVCCHSRGIRVVRQGYRFLSFHSLSVQPL